MSAGNYRVIDADATHGEAILALMPRLADYDVPESRNPKHLWEHDAEMLRQWLRGDAECLVQVAVDDDGKGARLRDVDTAPGAAEPRAERAP